MTEPVLSALNIYPLKSASGISLKNTEMEQRGLTHDRRWMVVNDSGQFVTQRTSPRMVLVQTQLANQTLTLNAPGMPELCLPLLPKKDVSEEVEIWGDRCKAWVANQQSTRWISEYLGKNCKIVYHLYIVFAKKRDELLKYCLKKGIEAKIHYPIPMYRQPAMKFLKHKKGDFPISDKHSKSIISFPCDQHLSKKQMNYVIKCVKHFYSQK